MNVELPFETAELLHQAVCRMVFDLENCDLRKATGYYEVLEPLTPPKEFIVEWNEATLDFRNLRAWLERLYPQLRQKED